MRPASRILFVITCVLGLGCSGTAIPLVSTRPPVVDTEDRGGLLVTLELADAPSAPEATLAVVATVLRERLEALGSQRARASVTGTSLEVFVPAQLAQYATPDGLFATHRLAFYAVVEERPSDAPATLAANQKQLVGRGDENPATYIVEIPAAITHEAVLSATTIERPEGTSLSIAFTESGSRVLEEVTGKLNGQRLAIAIDDRVVMAPTVREPITGGTVVVTGDWQSEQNRAVIAALNTTPLPAAVRVQSVTQVGPG